MNDISYSTNCHPIDELPKTYKVYKIVNTENNNTYIGKTSLHYWKNRVLNHRWKALSTTERRVLLDEIRIYGWDNFRVELLLTTFDKRFAYRVERLLIKEYKELNRSLNVYD